ncbi:MAG: BatA and WFA domain-containing protein [Clostridia bacterium]|nr:BatA and WFA domain-containing protein [Clostridia bacterium]
MRFLMPLGFLALLAIPVLILIYIIKSKYTEQTINSTYIWTLSEKFLKRRNPIRKITGIISLILQILAVVFIAIAIAHPVFTLPGRAQDYCFILDGSGSMNTVQNGTSRFDLGKERIRDVISSAADGSTFTLITTGNTTELAVKQSDDKKATLRQLDYAKAAHVASALDNARDLAQQVFDETPSCKFYVVTDKYIETVTNAELVNVAASVQNFAISDVKYSLTAEGGVNVGGKALSYENDADITVDLFVNGSSSAAASVEVQLSKNEGKDFTLECDRGDFQSLRVAIRQRDNLALDNSVTLYNARNDSSSSILLVSDTPFFMETTFAALGNMQTTVVSSEDYKNDEATGKYKGYGLYVFERFTPASMPEEGAVWLISPTENLEGSGFSVRGTETPGNTNLKLSTSTSSRVRNLLKGTIPTDKKNDGDGNKVSGDTVAVLEYVKCGIYHSDKFATLMTCGDSDDPVIFAGANSYGNREVVIALDMHTSDFVLPYNARIIMYNLINYTFPVLLEDADLYCGDSVSVNVLAGCRSIRVKSPSGKSEYLDVSSTMSDYELTEVGEYEITAMIGETYQTARVYAQLPQEERVTTASEAVFVINGEPDTHKRDGRYEDLLYAFIILAVIVVADWVVYCYEQYQLR